MSGRIASRFVTSLVACLTATTAATTAKADAVADFYKGKTFEIHVGFSAGGGYDAYARFLARHIGKHIPGNPAVVVKNRTGSGTIKLTNILYNVGPFDGTVMGMVSRAIPTHEMLGGKGAQFDSNQMNWVGSMNNEVSVCLLSDRAKAKSFADTLKFETVVGGQGAASDADQFALFVKHLLGSKFNLITGYPGTAVTVLAMDRGEVDGICGWSWSSVLRMRGEQIKSGKIRPVLQLALKKHPDLPAIPLITDLARNDSQRQQMELVFIRQAIGRPFVLPPKVPADRVEAIRKAFAATMKDPEFIAEAKKSDTEIDWVGGEEVQQLIARVLKTPKPVVEATRQNLFPKGEVQRAKLTYVDAAGTIAAIKSEGRRLELKGADGATLKTAISGSGTKITIGGQPAKRSALKQGMSCKISYLGPGTEARSLDCQ